MKHILFILILVGLQCHLLGQCGGSSGENIFTDGDFGMGVPNVLLDDPQIAPGYLYETNPPPNDGSYTITNNTSNWGSFANPNWANIKDNSTNPYGYMMIVNASVEPGLFYEQVVDDLCENTLFAFSADVFNLSDGIRPNVSFLIDGNVVYNTGNVPYNNVWNTYGFTFTTDPGQTSVTLALQNNAPGGDGNDLALDNISFLACGPEALVLAGEEIHACEQGNPVVLEASIMGNQYDSPVLQWQESPDGGMTWVDIPGATNLTYTHEDMAPGEYPYRYILANDPNNLQNVKCRVISSSITVNVIPHSYPAAVTLCEGQSFAVGNNEYAETGLYVDTLVSSKGCDSIVILDLFINETSGPSAVLSTDAPSCPDAVDGSIAIDGVTGGTPPYSILWESAPSPAGFWDMLGEGSYVIQVVDDAGCVWDTLITLTDPPPFTLDIGPDREVELGESLEVIPQFSAFGYDLLWEMNGMSIDCPSNCHYLSFIPTLSGQLSLSAVSSSGCIVSDSLHVRVDDTRKVYIPNSFSPNADGYNDYFTIYGAEPSTVSIEELWVFNRLGGVVYYGRDIPPNAVANGWDGTINRGKDAPADVYVFLAKIRFLDEEIVLYSGDVTLLR